MPAEKEILYQQQQQDVGGVPTNDEATASPNTINARNNIELQASSTSFWIQTKTLIKKDYRILSRNRKQLIQQILVPVITAIVAAFVAKSMLTVNNFDPTQDQFYTNKLDVNQAQCGSAWYSYRSYFAPSTLANDYPCSIDQYSSNGPFFYNNSAEMLENMSSQIIYTLVGQARSQYNYGTSYPYFTALDKVTDPKRAKLYYEPAMASAGVNTFNINYNMLEGPDHNINDFNYVSYLLTGSDGESSPPSRTLALSMATLVLIFGLLPFSMLSAARLVDDKRTRIRQHLFTMGCTTKAYVFATFLWSAIRGFSTATFQIIVFAAVVNPYYTRVTFAGWIGIWCVQVLFASTLAFFAHIPQVICSKPNLSNAVVSLFVMVGAVGANFVTLLPGAAQYAIAFFFTPISATFAIAGLLVPTPYLILPVDVPTSIVFMVISGVGYLLVGEYFVALFPGDYGVAKPWHFPITEILFCGTAKPNFKNDNPVAQNEESLLDNRGKAPLIKIRNLTKYYGSQRNTAANKNLDFDLYPGTICCLLARNGGGKTTLFNQLISFVEPTSYDVAEICGFQLGQDTEEIRKHICTCPQHDILFDDLSASEHLEFFTSIRGAPLGRGIELLQKLQLPLNDQLSKTFSGGMKRRLSVANCLAVNTAIVALDEPSSGLDPETQRMLWNVIKSERDAGKAILYTTHSMQEVEILADTCTIMSFGKTFCSGTVPQIKKDYGVGYFIKLVKKEATGIALDQLFERINKHCPGTSIHSQTATEVTLLLPLNALDNYGAMLAELEQNLDGYGFESFGISPNTLEDVFISIADKEAIRERAERLAAKGEAAPAADAGGDSTTIQTAGYTATKESSLSDDIIGGKKVSEHFRYSVEDNAILRFLVHVWQICKLRLRIVARSPRLVLLSGIVPFALICAAFALLIPLGGGGNSGTYNWINPTYEMPDPLSAKTFVPFVRRPIPNPGGPTALVNSDIEKIRDAFVKIYHKAYPGSEARFPIMDINDFNSGSAVSVDNIAFTSFPPLQAAAFFFSRIDLAAKDPLSTQIVMCNGCSDMYGTDNKLISDTWAGITALMLRAAVNSVISKLPGNTPHEPALDVDFKLAPLFYNETTTTTTTAATSTTTTTTTTTVTGTTTTATTTTPEPTYAPPSNGPQGFLTIATGIFVILAVMQYSCSNAVFVAEDLNRGSFAVLRTSGLSSMAYYCGVLLFDTIYFIPPLIAFIVGPFVRGAKQMEFTGVLVPNAIALVLMLWNVSVLSFIVITLLPRGLQQGVYLSICISANLFVFAFPFLVLAIAALANSNIPEFVLTSTPYWTAGRAFTAAIYETDPSRTSMNEPGKVFGSIVGWLVVEMFLLHFVSNRAAYDFAFNGVGDVNNTPAGSGNNNTSSGAQPSFTELQSEQAPLVISNDASAGNNRTNAYANMDPDVFKEMTRIEKESFQPTSEATDLVLASHVQKIYHGTSSMVSNANQNDTIDTTKGCCAAICGPSIDKLAVKDVSFAIQGGSVNSVIGKNGSGKSTLTRMLTCEENPTRGFVQRRRVRPDGSVVVTNGATLGFGLPSFDEETWQSRYSVCTQHNSLFEQLDAYQHLDLYLAIRLGSAYSAEEWKPYIEKCLRLVALDDAGGKTTAEYSGGMQRKLGGAISIMTGGSLSILDELSTGVDSHSRRALWHVMQDTVADKSRAIFLISHALDEIEACATNVALLKAGELMCFGSVQHLKNRFGSGYCITLYFDEPLLREKELPLDTVKASADEKLRGEIAGTGGGELKISESNGPTRIYTLETARLSVLFSALARFKEDLCLESYSVAQTSSLDSIFLRFAGSRAGEDQ